MTINTNRMEICLTALIIAILALSWGSPSVAQEYTSIARVIDGDTIEVSGQRIRLHGIDTPEHKQTCKREGEDWCCGVDATRALHDKIGEKPVRCEEQDRDRYRRIDAKCFFGDTDINEWLVLNGWAVAYTYYSYDYSRAEAFAKLERSGVWASEFVMLWEWRRGNR